MIRDYNGSIVPIYPEIVGDGITDDTEAVQDLVDNYEDIILPAGLTIKITEPITIDISKCHHQI